MSSCCSKVRLRTYSVEPIRPSSSAPHQAKRTRLLTLGEPPSLSATSSRAAEPEPLSLMPA